MSEQTETKFSWVLKKFSSLQDDKSYSRPFAFAGCNCLATSLGWRRDVKLSLTLVTKGWGKSNLVLGGNCCFDAKGKSWGYSEFVSLTKLRARNEGFLVNNELIILADLHLLSPPVVPKGYLKIIEKEINQAFDESLSKSHGDSSCQAVLTTENLDDEVDDDASEVGSDDDDVSQEGSEDDEASEDGSDDNKTEVSNGGNDDETKEDVDDDDGESSFVLIDGARDVSSPDLVKPLEDASQTIEIGGGKVFNNIASVTETSNNVLKETQPVKETMNVNGFEVFSSQAERVTHIFERHPSIAFDFRPKNQQIRRAYMNELLSLIEVLCQSPEELSETDLRNADDTLIDVGFKLYWLKIKLNEVSEKKKMQQGSGVRLQTMEEQLQNLETQMQKEKVEALAARVPLSFNDVVC